MGVHLAEWSPTLGRGLATPGGPTKSRTGGAHTRQTPVRHAHLRDPGRRGGAGGGEGGGHGGYGPAHLPRPEPRPGEEGDQKEQV